MTKLTMKEYMAMCHEYLIDAGLALENAAIRAALVNGDREELRRVLAEEF